MGDRSRRRIYPGLIEDDKDECAIVVHYEISQGGSSERTQHSKRLRLSTHILQTDPARLADDVMRKCRYIAESKRQFVEMLIANLQEYYARSPEALDNAEAAQEASRQRRRRRTNEDEPPNLEAIEEYVDMLYEGEEESRREKIRGTEKILGLCLYVGNLEHLIQHNTLMGAISRVLAEDYRKSADLTYNIVRVFLAFSNFMEMHAILSTYRVGSVCVDIIEYEVRRSQHREEVEEGLANQIAEAKVGLSDSREGIFEHENRLSELEKTQHREAARSRIMQRKQDKLLYVCLQVLLNLAEDTAVEHKMVRKNLTEHMSRIFAHSTSVPLLTLTASFLKKLSLFEENKDRMAKAGLVSRMARFISCSSSGLVIALLRLLFNLSFDPALRDLMVKNSLIPKLVTALKDNHKYREVSLRVLYHLSVDDRCKSLFTYTEAIPVVMQLIIKFPASKKITKELAALAVNLSLNRHNAELMCQNKGLQALVARVERTQDPLLMKVVRNLSLWTFNVQSELKNPQTEYAQRGLWARHVTPILAIATNTESHDMLVEVLGTLGNFTRHDLMRGVTWAKYLEELNLTGFLSKLLVPGMAQHDIVLEAVVFTGVLATERQAASLIASSSLARALEEVWRLAAEDAEIVLQLLFTFQRLLKYRETHDEILYNSRILLDILDCLDNSNPEIRRYADTCLDLVIEHDRDDASVLGELGAQVRQRRFYSHNRDWIDIIQQEDGNSHRGGHSSLEESDSMSPTDLGGFDHHLRSSRGAKEEYRHCRIVVLGSATFWFCEWYRKTHQSSSFLRVQGRLGVALFLPLLLGPATASWYAWFVIPTKLATTKATVSHRAVLRRVENLATIFFAVMVACIFFNLLLGTVGYLWLFRQPLHLQFWSWFVAANSTAPLLTISFLSLALDTCEALHDVRSVIDQAREQTLTRDEYARVRDDILSRSAKTQPTLAPLAFTASLSSIAALYQLFLIERHPDEYGIDNREYGSKFGRVIMMLAYDLYFCTLMSKEAVLFFAFLGLVMDVNDTADSLTAVLVDDGRGTRRWTATNNNDCTPSPLVQLHRARHRRSLSCVSLLELGSLSNDLASYDMVCRLQLERIQSWRDIEREQERQALVILNTSTALRPHNLSSFQMYFRKPLLQPITFDLAGVRVTRPLFFATLFTFATSLLYFLSYTCTTP
ncbi:hypothetical protein CTAYLR_009369 [Chrysophaeum taylorii]|uniref:Armadillo-type fold n=1 Tax=Chrysophaeum taylorii TaxID=2483200 RepID=A0AAD7UCT0_9STRA|nr:hypothetical protein CTAYLR_009369 [Chrysophaeum taylorii]